jgi:GxxExxY protein
MLELESLTERIIGAAITVHKALGPGFVESIYENASIIEMRKSGLRVDQQYLMVIEYHGIEVGRHRLDTLVEGVIIVENKVVEELDRHHFAQVKSYLKALRLKHGLLFNYAKRTLEIKRVIFEDS